MKPLTTSALKSFRERGREREGEGERERKATYHQSLLYRFPLQQPFNLLFRNPASRILLDPEISCPRPQTAQELLQVPVHHNKNK